MISVVEPASRGALLEIPRPKAYAKKVSITAVCLHASVKPVSSCDGHDEICAPKTSIIRPHKGSLDPDSSAVVPRLDGCGPWEERVGCGVCAIISSSPLTVSALTCCVHCARWAFLEEASFREEMLVLTCGA